MVDTKKENLTVNKLICERNETIFIEEDMIVPDSKPDILSAINTSGNICIYKKELTDEKLKIDGSINTCIMYLADDAQDNIRGIELNIDFSKNLNAPNCNSNMLLETKVKIKNINCNVINGRKINVKAEVEVLFKVYANQDIQFVNEIINNQDIQMLKAEVTTNSLVGSGSAKSYVKENIMINEGDNLAEILNISVSMVDKDTKTSYNKVLAKAEAEIKILYLTEDNRIVSNLNRIPIVGFVDIENVAEENICDTNFEIRNMIIRPNNVEEHSIYVEIEVEVSCKAYEEKNINLIQDLYSPLEELKCNKKQVEMISNKEIRTENYQIKENVNLSELGENGLIDANCVPKISNVKKINSKIMYEGEIQINFLYRNTSNQVNSTTSTIPYEFIIDNIKSGEMLNVDTELEMQSQDFVVKSGGNVLVNAEIKFNMNISKNQELKIIENIETIENRELEDYSLVIYIVKPGDTLWNIAKRLNSTVDDIAIANGIEDKNSIRAGEKLYIPKYIKKEAGEQVEAPIVNYA